MNGRKVRIIAFESLLVSTKLILALIGRKRHFLKFLLNFLELKILIFDQYIANSICLLAFIANDSIN
jgi:hypothetical protein